MKVRVIQRPEFTYTYTLQVKTWWWPFWVTLHHGEKESCLRAATNLMETGDVVTVLFQGEVKQ